MVMFKWNTGLNNFSKGSSNSMILRTVLFRTLKEMPSDPLCNFRETSLNKMLAAVLSMSDY